jgi:hypothetical protein
MNLNRISLPWVGEANILEYYGTNLNAQFTQGWVFLVWLVLISWRGGGVGSPSPHHPSQRVINLFDLFTTPKKDSNS